MRVALLQTPTAPLDLSHTGGLEVVELSQLDELRRRGVEAHLYAAQVKGEREGVRELRDWGQQRRLGKYAYYYALARRERAADVFHGHYTPALALTHPHKSVVHFHGLAVSEIPLYRYFPSRCHRAQFVFCSRWIAERFAERYPRVPAEHMHVIYNGVDHQAFHPPAEPRPPGSPTRIIFYAGWLPQKGIYELLAAARLLEARRQDWELHFGGSAFSHYRRAESEEIDRRVREEAARLSCVRLIGHIPHEDLPELLRTMDVGVVPSVYEDPFPLVPLEMMGCGLPVVAFRAGGLKESVVEGETGFLVENKNVPALAQALETLIDNVQLRWQMGEKGRRRVEQYFTWERHVDQVLAVYERIIRRNYRKQ